MEQQIRFCTASDGVRIAYSTVGEGPPLIRIPGWVSHLEVRWEDPQYRGGIEALAQHSLVVLFDKRGTGLSDRNVSDFSIDARLLDLEAVVDNLKLQSFALQGLSEGGPIAIAYAARHPDRVSRLILQGTFARMQPTPERQATIDALIALVQAEWGLGSRTLTDLFMPDASPEEIKGFVKMQQAGATKTDAAAMLKANFETDVFDLLSQIKAPTLVIHAKGDRVIPFEEGRELAGVIPNARLLPIDSDRHAPDKEGAELIRQAVIDFLSEGTPAQEEPRSSSPRDAGPLTILFTDMESSTALTQRLGDAKAQELVRAHNTIVRDALSAHNGSEIKHTGDGIMASFAAASTALNCAVAIQRAIEDLQGETPFRVRIGLNSGEPIAEDDDLFGTAVQLASRICASAEPAQILASDVVRQLVAGKGFLFSDHGDVALRGFEDPVRLYEVRWREE